MADASENEAYPSPSVDVISNSQSAAQEKLASIKKCRVTVEPVVFLGIVAMGTMMVTMQSFIINSVCERQNQTANSTVIDCSNLTANKEEETDVQLEAVQYVMYSTVISTSLVLLYSLFLGEWIKRNGCKLTIVLPDIGFVAAAIYLVFLSYSRLSMNTPLILLVSVPIGISGGLLALITSSYSYVSRITSIENRSFRLGILHMTVTLGAPVGLLAATEMQSQWGFTGVFLLCLALNSFALIYAIFLIPNDGPDNLSWSMFRGFCGLDAIKETLLLCIKRRDGSRRMWLNILYIALALRVVTQTGSDTVLYLFTRLKFEWSSVDYSDFVAVDCLISLAGLIVVTVIGMKILKLNDCPIGAMAAISSLGGSILWIFAWAGWVPYLASAIQVFGGAVYLLVRSSISKIVKPEEMGTAFVLAGILDTVVPLGASPLYDLIYSKTLGTVPSSFFFVTSSCNFLIFLVFIFLSTVMPASVSEIETPILDSEETSTVEVLS